MNRARALLGAFVVLTGLAMACGGGATPSPAPTLQPTSTPTATYQLLVVVEPQGAADYILNPKPDAQGAYIAGTTVTIDVLPSAGWQIERWVGLSHDVAEESAKVNMDSSHMVAVRLIRKEAPTRTLTPTPMPVVTEYDYRSLIDDLRSAGATVEETGWPSDVFSVEGRSIAVNGNRLIWVFEFPDDLAADTEAGYVSPDGYNISVPLGDGRYTGSHYEWLGPPHFYKKGRVIVLYVGPEFGGFFIGDDPPLVEVLQRALGPEFAGFSFITR